MEHRSRNVPDTGGAQRGTHFRVRASHGDGGYTPATDEGGIAVAVARQDEQSTAADYSPGSIGIAPFAQTIRPVGIVSVLPTLPNGDYPINAYVVLTTNSRLYKNIAGAWVLGVDGSDIVADSITAGQIAAGAIATSELAAGAVTAVKIQVGTVTSTEMAGDPKNLIPNPGGEAATASGQTTLAGWTLGSGMTIRWDGVWMRSGKGVFQYVCVIAGASATIASTLIPVQGNRRYRFSVWGSGYSGNTAGLPAMQYIIQWRDVDAVLISQVVVGSDTPGTRATFVQMAATALSPTNAVTCTVLMFVAASVTVGQRYYFDDFEAELADQDIDHAAGNVVIDSTGVTITNGKLSVLDTGGKSTITGGGIAVGAINVGQFAGAPGQLVPNNGFEADGAAVAASNPVIGWGSGPQFTTAWSATPTSHTGKGLALLTWVSGTLEQLSNAVPIIANRRIRVRGWVAGSPGNSVNATAAISYYFLDSAGSTISSGSFGSTAVGAATTWVQVSVILAPPAATATIKFGLRNTGGTSVSVTRYDDLEAYYADDDVSHAAGDVVIDSTGITITNGKLTVSNPSSTVIIDGTSNMFKIAATGTLTKSVLSATASGTSVVLTGLAPGVIAPMLQATAKWDGGATTSGKLATAIDAVFAFAAATSGGATTLRIGQMNLAGYWYTDTNGATSDALISLFGQNASAATRTLSGRYYVMKEAAL